MIRKVALATALLPLLVVPAHAQSWLENLAKSAAEQVARQAVDRVISGQPASAPASAASPAPVAAGPARVSRRLPADLPKPQDAQAKKDAFEAFSAYPCSDCEGGRGYDAWARQSLNLIGSNLWEDKVGSLAVGQTISWKGERSDGVLTVVSENAMGGLPCKQVVHRLTKHAGGATAERDGLFCYGKASQYSGSDSWVEVY